MFEKKMEKPCTGLLCRNIRKKNYIPVPDQLATKICSHKSEDLFLQTNLQNSAPSNLDYMDDMAPY
jgi:hypothetical protein